MDERAPATVSRPWNRDKDLLVLFTDGVSDARNRDGRAARRECRAADRPFVRRSRALDDPRPDHRVAGRNTATEPRSGTISRSYWFAAERATKNAARIAFGARTAAGPQEPRAAFPRRPAHPRAHRRRARPERRRHGHRDRTGAGKSHRGARAARRPARRSSSTIAHSPRGCASGTREHRRSRSSKRTCSRCRWRRSRTGRSS